MVRKLRFGHRRKTAPRQRPSGVPASVAAQKGITFVEVLTVLTVISILIVMAEPSFTRTIEQAHADIAGANLKAIWSAQRCFWLENRTYADTLAALADMDLLDSTITAGTARYTFAITGGDADSFQAEATRTGSSRWSGEFVIDETGVITGVIQASGKPNISPGLY